MAGSFATSISRVAEVPERVLAEELDLPLRPAGVFVGLGREHPRREPAVAYLAVDLRVGGGEMVVPEERHLLLQRALRVHHPEQPALAGVENVVRWLEAAAAASRHADISRPADERIHIVGNLGVVEKARHRRGIAGKRQAGVRLDLFLAGAKSGSPVEMVDLLLSAEAHRRGLQAARERVKSYAPSRGAVKDYSSAGLYAADYTIRASVASTDAAAMGLDRAIQGVVT